MLHLLWSNHVALQAESQPVDFGRIELRDLVSCMTREAKHYRPYSVKDAIVLKPAPVPKISCQ